MTLVQLKEFFERTLLQRATVAWRRARRFLIPRISALVWLKSFAPRLLTASAKVNSESYMVYANRNPPSLRPRGIRVFPVKSSTLLAELIAARKKPAAREASRRDATADAPISTATLS